MKEEEQMKVAITCGCFYIDDIYMDVETMKIINSLRYWKCSRCSKELKVKVDDY